MSRRRGGDHKEQEGGKVTIIEEDAVLRTRTRRHFSSNLLIGGDIGGTISVDTLKTTNKYHDP